MPERPTPNQDTALLPDGYRLTELGPLPEEWKIVKGADLFQRSTLLVKHLKGRFDGEILSITRHSGLIPQNQKFGKKIAGDDITNYKVVSRGQLVYGFPINEGVLAISPYPLGAVSPAYQVWNVVREDVDLEFIDWLVKQPFMIAQYMRFATNVVHRRKNLKPQDFMKVLFPLPPLPEQRAIAHMLRTVQKAKEATERVIAALRELKKSLMRYLFTYGPVPLDAADRVELKDTEISPLPAHWQVAKLGDVANMKQGKVLPTKAFTPSGFPVFGANGQIGWYSEYTHEESEVVVTCRGATCGTVNVTPPKAFITNNAMVVSPINEEVLAKAFLPYALTVADLKKAITGTGQPQITKATLSACRIVLPPISEQREIARILQAVDEKIQAEEKRKEALEALFKALLHYLMTAKIRLPKEFVTQFEGVSSSG